VEVIEKDGIFTVNFTPTESGDWQIAITYDDQHILGSPFTVRVYDPEDEVKVIGIDRASMMADMAKFSIETSGSGQGQLTVDITYKGRDIPATIEGEGRNRYHISFNPIGGGTYTIRVYYGGEEVTGSPYHMEIIDAGEVVATGEGLVTSEINRRANFFLNLGMNGSVDEVKVQIISPRGANVPASVLDNHNGNVTVEFIPTEVGEHVINVFYFGKSVVGSPYRCQVFDWSKINLVNLQTTGIVDRPVEFDIDASLAGAGNLEIMVNDGNIPCSVQNCGNRNFRASFIPVDPIPHYIRMKFNNRDIPGSPWRVDVRNPAMVTVASNNVQFVPVGRVSDFDVRTSTIDGELVANITAPSRRTLRANVINMRNGTHRVEFTPMEVGSHLIELIFDGMIVPGTPFTAKAYNTAAIAVSPINPGFVGMPVEFSIDVSQAGEGQLEIMINKGTVPNQARMVSKGLFSVSFIPREARPHEIDIRFNGEPLPQGTIVVPIMNSNRSMSESGWYNDGLREQAVNRQSYFHLPAQSISEQDLTVRVTSPSGELVPAKMVLQPDGDYKVEYSSRFTGRHTVEILHMGMAIMGSPFYVEIYDPNKIRVEGTRTGLIGERMEFDIIRHLAGKAEMKLTITGPRGNSVPYEMYTTSTGEHVTYHAREAGVYQIFITYGGLKVPGCPIKQEIFDNASISVYGEGLSKGYEDQVATFYVDAKGQSGDVGVQIDGPNSVAKYQIDRESNGRYRVTYIPVECGIYRIVVKWNGHELDGSPFQAKVVDPRKVYVIGGWESVLDANNRMRLKINETKVIEFDTRNAGPGQLSVEVRGPDGNIPVDVVLKERDRYVVSFVPRVEGEYVLKVMWNGVMLAKCPVSGTVTKQVIQVTTTTTTSQNSGASPKKIEPVVDILRSSDMASRRNMPMSMSPSETQLPKQSSAAVQTSADRTATTSTNQQPFAKVIMTGVGIKQAFVNQLSEFFIDGINAGPGSPSIQLTGLKGDVNVTCTSIGNSKYRCTYVPQHVGTYLLYISWGERQVVGSPYKLNVLPLADAAKVVISGDNLQAMTMGNEISTVIDTRRAGTGELTAHCMGPTRVALCQLIDHRDGTFLLLVRPQEPGKHILQVKFAGEHIQGSPFTLRVAGLPDPSKVHVSGPGIQDGVLAVYQSRFKVDTVGAGGGELTVKIRGPKGAFRVEMQRQSQKDRTIQCRYDPSEPGDYFIQIKWSGEHVPGSPFHVHIAETPEELHRYKVDIPRTTFGGAQGNGNVNGLWHDDFD